MPKQVEAEEAPKQVVYLWGAGATQAEINYLGASNINLLMRDTDEFGVGVATRVLKRLPEEWQSSFVSDQGMDIEKVISLLSATNVAAYHQLADKMRQLYFDEICESLVAARVLLEPRLAVGLLTMHRNETFKSQETLSGVITTNHDGLLQLAAQQVNGEVNIGVPFRSDHFVQAEAGRTPVLHLHGSFTWAFDVPLKVSALTPESTYSPDAVWIPPTILKESKSYPFNKLAGLAYEILSKHCDVLRVVGSALTQNDWNVLSMIFNAQRHRKWTKGHPFRVELVMPHRDGMAITRECSYLEGLTPIGYLTDGDEFPAFKEDDDTGLSPEMKNPEMKNPLFFWMKQKIQFHKRRGDFGAAPLDPAIAQIAGEIP